MSGPSDPFTHCASCGELPAPPGNRLCVSIPPDWTADAVLLCGGGEAGSAADAASLRAAMPWLRRIHVEAGADGTDYPDWTPDLIMMPDGITEADLPGLESLAEYFIVFRPGRLPANPLLPADFFTPNGIPLLFVQPGDGDASGPPVFLPGPFCRTKSLARLFAESTEIQPALDEYAEVFARWAYAEQHAILALCPF
ncbi:MAG: hypothetical protein LBR94_10365 [Desulfovibrio sp.]|nr:hypothetical protein [Desulfovibrio sp.]